MPVLRALVTLNPSAEPEDRFVNTWHYKPNLISGDVQLAALAFQASLNTFYQAIDLHLSNVLAGAVPEVRHYDMSDPKIRVPFLTSTLTALGVGANAAPAELAICLSYNAAYESGQEPRRRRGRIYLGPWYNTAHDSGTGRVAAATVTIIANAAQVLLDASQASADFTWVVYSRKDDAAENGDWNTGREVIRSYIDNAWDIQRRRGLSSGARTVQT